MNSQSFVAVVCATLMLSPICVVAQSQNDPQPPAGLQAIEKNRRCHYRLPRRRLAIRRTLVSTISASANRAIPLDRFGRLHIYAADWQRSLHTCGDGAQ